MTDTSRFEDWIFNYFPEPKFSRQDVNKWANDNVPAWKNVWGKKQKERMLDDWENLVYETEVEPEVMELVKGKSAGFLNRAIKRIREFLGRLF